MSGHDAASVVGQMAGLNAGEPQADRVSPDDLIRRFCTDVPEGYVANPGIHGEDGVITARGFCSYMGGRGDGWQVGFDDGYDFMGHLGERGWRMLAAKGDWPYLVYLAYAAREPYAIAEYCEGDLTVWVFETAEAAQAHYRGLKDCP